MKILMVSLYFYPDKTGVPKYSGELAHWLAARGHEVVVLAGAPHYPNWKRDPNRPGTGFTEENWDGVTIYRVPHFVPNDGKINTAKRLLIDLTYLTSGAYAMAKLALKKHDFDVAIAVCPPLFSGLLSFAYKTLSGVPWVFHVQDFQVDAAIRLNLLKIGKAGEALYWLEGYLLGAASRVASITPAMCKRAVEKGARKSGIYLLPNWGDLVNIKPVSKETDFRKSLDAKTTDTVVMYAGAMGAKQGLDLVLDAAERVKHRKDIRFVMVGGGPEWNRLCEQAGERGLDNMMFVPLQPVARLNEMLNSADVHLVIQKSEAADIVMPSKLVNIFAAGRPAIATADPGTALYQAMEDSGAGIIIRPENADDLEAAILKMADHPADCAQMGTKARTYAEENLDQDKILGRFEVELEQTAKTRRGAANPLAALLGR